MSNPGIKRPEVIPNYGLLPARTAKSFSYSVRDLVASGFDKQRQEIANIIDRNEADFFLSLLRGRGDSNEQSQS
jgi:hypothetical protein